MVPAPVIARFLAGVEDLGLIPIANPETPTLNLKFEIPKP